MKILILKRVFLKKMRNISAKSIHNKFKASALNVKMKAMSMKKMVFAPSALKPVSTISIILKNKNLSKDFVINASEGRIKFLIFMGFVKNALMFKTNIRRRKKLLTANMRRRRKKLNLNTRKALAFNADLNSCYL